MALIRTYHKLKNKPALSRWLFYLGLLVYLMPVYLLPLFPTLDGAAHLYSASLIARWSEIPIAHDLLLQQPIPPPNILSHWIMASLWSFLSPIAIEKFIVVLCLALPAIAAELLCRQKGISSINAILILPLLHNFLLYMGFYNFVLGSGILLLSYVALGYLHRKRPWLIVLIVLISGALMYFAHIFILPFFTFVLLIDYLFSKARVKRIALLTSLAPLILSVYMFYNNFVEKTGEPINIAWPNIGERLDMLVNAQPLIIFYQSESQRTMWFSALLLILLLAELLRIKRWSFSGRAFGVISLGFLLAFLVVPDELMGGAILAIRLQLIFLYMLIFLLILEVRRGWQRIIIILFIISYGPYHLHYQTKANKDLSYLGSQLYHIGQNLDRGGIVVPIYFNDNWLEAHVANYAGLQHPVIIADFYEALNPHFPFYFNPKANPYTLMGMDQPGGRTCPDIPAMEAVIGHKVQYIINIKKRPYPEGCYLDDFINDYFDFFEETDDCVVYKRVNN